MKKQTALIVGLAAGLVAAATGLLAALGYLPALVAELIAVVAFPAFVIFIALWWNAKPGEEDIPFIGY
ncbi:MAG: energy-converting hydrogenase subunit [Methanomicrobiaceae archaeon]|jgi:energy-converting hydrogenase A subunit I|nr:energy-converting hydrogenase subunit [Methanomicrobiaceae archaeon]MDK2863494.1 energy-converting hydrogenase subunit [Methanomicrobiaceae archaeon]MDK2990657.1 energy-converting hydrogenase subunit [Methanoculleus sp.]